MSAEGIITGDTRRYHNMPMLTSEFTPSWASDTSWASPPGHLPFPVPWSVSDCFKDPCWATNSSYFDGNDVFCDTLNDSDGQSSLIRQNYQLALSPIMPSTWLGVEDYVFGGPTDIVEATPSPGFQIERKDSWGDFCNPADTILPQSSLSFQFEHQLAQAIEATDNSHCDLSGGDIRPENSHLCRNPALDTLRPVEPASKIDMTVTELDTRSTRNTLYPCYANSVCYDNTITLPGLASSVQHEHILGHPLEQLPACSPPEHPCQDLASVATFSHEFAEPPENPKLSCHTYVSHSQPQGHISVPTLHSPFSPETTHSNNLEILDPIDASLLFVVAQTQCGENISHYHKDSVCESSPFECTYNSFTHQFDEYSSTMMASKTNISQ